MRLKFNKKIYNISFLKKIFEITKIFKSSNIIRGKFSDKFEYELKKKIGNSKLITTSDFSSSIELLLNL